MSKKDEKSGELTPEQQLEAYLKDNKEDHYNFEESVDYKISTGSLLMDIETGGLGPGVHRLVGQNNQGKTPESILILNNFLDTIPNSRGMYIKAEGRLSDENMARSKRKFTINAKEWANDTIFVLETNIYETIVNLLRSQVKHNPHKIKYGIIFDSTDALILKGDTEKTAEDALKVAGPALISKKFLQALNLAMTKFGHLVIMIGHATAEVKIDPYAKTLNRGGMYSGGSALQHFPNFILEYQPRQQGDVILDPPGGKLNDGKSKAIGHFCRVAIRKSSKDNKDKVVLYPIKYKTGSVWLEYEIVDLLMLWDMVTKKGSWLAFESGLLAEIRKIQADFPEQCQGIDNLRDKLESHPEVVKYLYNKFKKVLSTL